LTNKEGIAELGQTDQMIVVAEVYESDIRKVRLGQRVTITSEGKAFEGELRGTVSQIGLKLAKKIF
jgi:HlyD family secretion protein